MREEERRSMVGGASASVLKFIRELRGLVG